MHSTAQRSTSHRESHDSNNTRDKHPRHKNVPEQRTPTTSGCCCPHQAMPRQGCAPLAMLAVPVQRKTNNTITTRLSYTYGRFDDPASSYHHFFSTNNHRPMTHKKHEDAQQITSSYAFIEAAKPPPQRQHKQHKQTNKQTTDTNERSPDSRSHLDGVIVEAKLKQLRATTSVWNLQPIY